MGQAAAAFYGLFLLVALINFGLMRRLRKGNGAPRLPIAALIPARNESGRIGPLVRTLLDQGARVYVYDDDSDDGTAAEALAAGAVVLRGGPLPEGWTGKSHACHNLAMAASEDFSGEWAVFLDADVVPQDGFVASLACWAATRGRRIPVLSGFPRFLPGRGLEPYYLSWVTWILLCTNPFGIVSRTGIGHNAFLNGQVILWRLSSYMDLLPHSQVRSAVLEDVKIGRLLARQKVRVEIASLKQILAVKMYQTLSDALRGMEKNSSEIAGPGPASWMLGGLLMLIGLLWAFLPWPWGVACLGIFAAASTLQVLLTGHPWPILATNPIALIAGALTIIRSSLKRRHHGSTWKGRTYH